MKYIFQKPDFLKQFFLVIALVTIYSINIWACILDSGLGGEVNGLRDNVTGNRVRNETATVSNYATVSILPGSSSPNNGRFFVPNLLNVSIGTTVTWTNRDLTSYKSFEVEQLHTVTSGTLESKNIGTEFDSSFLGAGKTFQHTFDSAGIFDYFCTIHPFMTGKVLVSS